MEKIRMDLCKVPMLAKGIEAHNKQNEGNHFPLLCHIGNFLDMYNWMLNCAEFKDDHKEIVEEMDDLNAEIARRGNYKTLCGEIID